MRGCDGKGGTDQVQVFQCRVVVVRPEIKEKISKKYAHPKKRTSRDAPDVQITKKNPQMPSTYLKILQPKNL